MRLVVISLFVLTTMARADPPAVALLPLDADPALEIYGQPVASELARALVAGKVEVVVVGSKAAVPELARLVVDGTVKSGKGGTVQLSIRIRDRDSGTVIETLQATAASIQTIDGAAEELSGRVVPAVKQRLAALVAHKPVTSEPAVVVATPVATPMPIAIVLVDAKPGALAPLHDALASAVDAWARHGRHAHADATAITPKAVASANAEIGIELEVLAYEIDDLVGTVDEHDHPKTVPSARARVRMRVANGTKVVFDRVISTDTVIGDRAHLAELVARDVLWIAEPHLRGVSAWK